MHYHRDGAFDSLGGDMASEGLHKRDHYKVPL